MNERARDQKPETAKDAAMRLVRWAIDQGLTPDELITDRYGLYRPDSNVVVGQVFGANPRQEIRPDEIGVIGFDPGHRGVVFSVAALWDEALAEQRQQVRQERLC